MAGGRDDDALSWGDEEDPTLDVGGFAPAAPSELPPGFTAVGRGSDAVRTDAVVSATDAENPDEEPAPMGNAALVSLGVLGGVYLLLAIGWWIGGSRLQLIAQLFLEPVAFLVAWVLAVLAAPIWFATVFLLTRTRPAWLRFLLLVAGAIVLLPWPFLMTGVAS